MNHFYLILARAVGTIFPQTRKHNFERPNIESDSTKKY
jgi:hypothetical protein